MNTEEATKAAKKYSETSPFHGQSHPSGTLSLQGFLTLSVTYTRRKGKASPKSSNSAYTVLAGFTSSSDCSFYHPAKPPSRSQQYFAPDHKRILGLLPWQAPVTFWLQLGAVGHTMAHSNTMSPRWSKYSPMPYNSSSIFLTRKVIFTLQGPGFCSIPRPPPLSAIWLAAH